MSIVDGSCVFEVRARSQLSLYSQFLAKLALVQENWKKFTCLISHSGRCLVSKSRGGKQRTKMDRSTGCVTSCESTELVVRNQTFCFKGITTIVESILKLECCSEEERKIFFIISHKISYVRQILKIKFVCKS